MKLILSNKRQLNTVLLAGLCGGLAEIGWIALYSSLSSANGAEIAGEVAKTVFSSASNAPWAPCAGVTIHLLLSLALGLGFALVLRTCSASPPAAQTVWTAALLTLTGIWAANFLLILPAINPAFVALVPYSVSLVSKILFAIAMAGVMLAAQRASTAERPWRLRSSLIWAPTSAGAHRSSAQPR